MCMCVCVCVRVCVCVCVLVRSDYTYNDLQFCSNNTFDKESKYIDERAKSDGAAAVDGEAAKPPATNAIVDLILVHEENTVPVHVVVQVLLYLVVL